MTKIDPNITYTALYVIITAMLLGIRKNRLVIKNNMYGPILITSLLNVLDMVTTFIGSGFELRHEGNYWVVNHHMTWMGLVLLLIAWQLMHLVFIDFHLNEFKVSHHKTTSILIIVKNYFISNNFRFRVFRKSYLTLISSMTGGLLNYFCCWAFVWYVAEKIYTITNNALLNFVHNNSKITTNVTTNQIEIIRNENILWNTWFEDIAIAHYTNLINHNHLNLTILATFVNGLTFIWFFRKEILATRRPVSLPVN